MADNAGYYNTSRPDTVTYLEFGHINLSAGSKTVYDYYQHQRAYDFFMLGRYGNDLAAFSRLTRTLDRDAVPAALEEYRREVHTADLHSNLAKLTGLAALGRDASGGAPVFFEVGTTIFGCIEAMLFLQRLGAVLGVDLGGADLARVAWTGVEISSLLLELGELMHPGYDVTTVTSIEDAPQRYDLFFGKGVSLLYAFKDAPSLHAMLDRSRLAVFDVSFCLEGAQRCIINTGKYATYLSFEEFHDLYAPTGKRLYFNTGSLRHVRDKGRVRTDALFCTPEMFERFMAVDAPARAGLAAALEPGDASDVVGPLPQDGDFRALWADAAEVVAAL